MSGFVADASVVAAWVLHDESTESAVRLFDRAKQEGFVVPFIWPAEIANVLLTAERRGRISPAERVRAIQLLAEAPFQVDSAAQESLCSAAADLAVRRGLSLYDALYLELAIRRGAPLATFDRRLISAARDEGVTLL